MIDMSSRSILESLRGNHDTRLLIESGENLREYFKGNDGRTYSVINIESAGEKMLQISVISPYDLTDYCFAHQRLQDSDKEYDPDESEDDQMYWAIYSPKGDVVSTLQGSSSWVAVADEIARQDEYLNLTPKIDYT